MDYSSVRNVEVRPSFPEFARQVGTKDQDRGHFVVPHRPPSSPAVFHCFPMLSAVFRRPPPSPAVLCSYLTPPGRSCLRSWGSSSLLMTAALGIQGPGRVKFCRPISSGGLGSPPTVPYGGPGRLRTPDYRRCCVQTLAYVSECDHQDGESQGGW